MSNLQAFSEPDDPNFQFQDNRTWITRELILGERVKELEAERDFLRRALASALEALEKE